MNNEERFIASCEIAGEADVRSKLSSSRFSEQKVLWATNWLEAVENGKSDTTRAAEGGSSENPSRATHRFAYALSTLVAVVLIAAAIIFFKPS